jgi:hypothetical protein
VTSRLTLSAAARLWGKSRQTLYTDVKAGRLSLGRDERDAVYVDAAEMVRAYGEPPSRRDGPADEAGQAQDGASKAVLKDAEIRRLEDVVALLREQVATLRTELDRAHGDKERQAETHRQVLRLLEHRPPPPPPLVDRVRGLFAPRRA